MLDPIELSEVADCIRETIDKNLEATLSKLNRTGDLDTLLHLLGIDYLHGKAFGFDRPKDGKIIVIGQSSVGIDILRMVVGKQGFEKSRFEFLLEYEDAKKYDFRKTLYSTAYTAILVGPMGHSGKAKEDYSSIITALEQQDGYPPVYRMGFNELKISKSSFQQALIQLKSDAIIV